MPNVPGNPSESVDPKALWNNIGGTSGSSAEQSTAGMTIGSAQALGFGRGDEVRSTFDPQTGEIIFVARDGKVQRTGQLSPDFVLMKQMQEDANGQFNPESNPALMQARDLATQYSSGAMGERYAAAVNPGINQFSKDLELTRAAAQGQAPSAAEQLAKSQIDQGIRAQMAVAASGRGGNLAAASRAAALTGSNATLQSARDIGALRANEMANARADLLKGQGAKVGMLSDVAGNVANLSTTGLQAQQNLADQITAARMTAHNVQREGQQDWINHLMNLYGMSSGIAANYQANNQQAQIAQRGQTLQVIGAAGKGFGDALSAIGMNQQSQQQ